MEKQKAVTEGYNKTEKLIGSDEVGKIEPLRRLIVVAAYVPEGSMDKIIEMGAGQDSKNKDIDSAAVTRIGRELTEFQTYSDCKNGVYYNKTYDISYSVQGITNKEYNDMKEKKSYNANKVLSILHNRANYELYQSLSDKGIAVEKIIIDDFTDGSEKNFREKYLNGIHPQIYDLENTTVCLEKKAESKFPTVGCASIIGSYIEQLWHQYVRQAVENEGGDAGAIHFGNATEPCKHTFKILEECFGSVDNDMVDIKHTSYYDEYMKK